MSDMQVVAILTPELSAPVAPKPELLALEKKMFEEIAQATFKSRPKRKSAKGSSDIVFEGPSAAEVSKYSGEPTHPLCDSQGRSRWIVSHECWCSPSSPNECRMAPTVAGRKKVCPSKPKFAQSEVEPRKLWSSNPDFGKPPVEVEEAKEVEVEA